MQLHHRSDGNGPDVILLHGLFGAGENLGVITRGLSGAFRTHSLDLRNHGRSPHAAEMDYPSMAEDVLDTMDALEIDEAAVIGHSMGGKVAMELAMAVPDRISHLTVLDIAPVDYDHHHHEELEAMRSLDADSLATRRDADSALAKRIPSDHVRQFLLKNLVRKDQRFAWRIPLDTIAEEYPALARAPSPGQYSRPVLFIAGANSGYVRSEHEQPIRERFPDARIEYVPEAAHWVHNDAPDAVLVPLRRFLHSAPKAS